MCPPGNVITNRNIFCIAAVLLLVTVAPVSAQFVEFNIEKGSAKVTGAVPASNTFDDDFFWDFKSSNFSRAGFEDGTIYPYAVYPWFDASPNGAKASVTEHAGHDTALKCYWTAEAGDAHFEIRGFSKARDELWWSFDLYVPEADPDDPDAPRFPDDRDTVISQVWHKGVGPMMVALKIINNRLKVMNHGGPSARMSEELPRGEWNEVTLQVKPSLAGNGTYRLWYGGEKVIDRSGVRVTCGYATEEDFTEEDRLVEGEYMDPYFGVYAQDPEPKNGKADERTLFFDNVTSYGGEKSVLRVEGEHFNDYLDASTGNRGGFYRTDEDVDIGLYWDDVPYEGFDWHPRQGFIVYYVDATKGTLEQLQYDIEIPEAGSYRFSFRTAALDGGGSFVVSLENGNGASKELGEIRVPDTTGGERGRLTDRYRVRRGTIPDWIAEDAAAWTFTTVSGPTAFLKPGTYTVTFDVKEGNFMLDRWEADLFRDDREGKNGKKR